MPWEAATVSEQRQRFLEDYGLNYYSPSELAERFGVSRKTAHKWIARFEQSGQSCIHELSRRPHSCPWQTHVANLQEIPNLRMAHSARVLGSSSNSCANAIAGRPCPWCPTGIPAGPQRHLGCRREEAVSPEERPVLLPTDGQRPGPPLRPWTRRATDDLPGPHNPALQRLF